MNLQYVKYALEIARTGSISKAAENLSVAQPNLSRAVKELESQLGISIFERTRTGMTVTPEGDKFLTSGERILRDVAELSTMFDGEVAARETISLSLPSAAYLSEGVARFCRSLSDDGRYDLTFSEVGATDAMGCVLRGESRLGIIRYASAFGQYYADMMAQKGLVHEDLHAFRPIFAAGLDSPLAICDTVEAADLVGLYAVSSPDSLPLSFGEDSTPRCRCAVTGGVARYDIPAVDPRAYIYTSPLPAAVAARYGLVSRPAGESVEAVVYHDMLVYPKGYRMSEIERRLIQTLREVFPV